MRNVTPIAAGEIRIRSGLTSEGSLLTELAMRSKAHWGYDAQFLNACRGELTITSDFLSSNVVFVLEEKGIVVGFYSLERLTDNDVELVHLFVEPSAIGRGHGKRLWLHACQKAREARFNEMVIKSDPFAETFYTSIGAHRVEMTPSDLRPGRMIPLLRFKLGG